MVNVSGAEVYIIALILVAIIGGIINTFQLINFIKQSKSRFLSSRNPQLIILYCIISLTTAFTTTPFNLYYHELPDLHEYEVPFFAKFATEFFQEFCTAALLVIILCRSWLLYYDYKFSESSSDEIWRNIVNSNEENFWIKHRKTLGNIHFIICVSLIVDSVSLLALSLIGSYVLTQEDSKVFHYFSLFGLGIPFCSFIVYLIYNKIKLINDIYLIHKELKYLSICIIVRIVAFSADLFVFHQFDNYLFFYTVEVVTTFLAVWIQCRWVINKLKEIEKEKDLDLYINFSSNSNDERKKSARNKNLLTMIDIFEQQTSFEIFIRHCNHELSVESVLFMIEISQFKATLYRYNAFGIEALNQRFINSINTNFIKYFKEKRRAKINKQIIIHPLYDDASPSLSPSPSPSPLSPISVSNKSDINNVRRIELKSDKQYFVASMKQESEYSHFQQNILDKKWLPLNKLLLDIKETEKSKTKSKTKSGQGSKTKSGEDNTEKSKTKSKTRTKSVTNTQTKSGTVPTITAMTKTKSLSKTGSNNKFMSGSNNLSLSPISLAVINDGNNNNAEEEVKKEESANSKTKSKSKSKEGNVFDKNMTVDIHWIYEYGKYLYDKYVDDSANLSINVSHTIRKDLWSVYSKRFSEEAFQKIQLLHHDYLSNITHLTAKEEQLFIQTYLYHSFDDAFHSVWCLLKSDTFYRFQKGKKYKELCEEADEKKIREAKILRDNEYSQSFKESQID